MTLGLRGKWYRHTLVLLTLIFTISLVLQPAGFVRADGDDWPDFSGVDGNIDGLGLLGFESLVERDYPIVLGVLVISSILGLLGNILSDLCVALVDPRVKFD